MSRSHSADLDEKTVFYPHLPLNLSEGNSTPNRSRGSWQKKNDHRFKY